MSRAPFPITPELTAVAVMYRNQRLVADQVAPRVPVGKQEFKWFKHALAEGFTVPDTRVGRRSRPGEVEFSASEETSATVDYGLDDPIPQADIDNAPENYDPQARAVQGIMDLVLLDREKRTADLVFNPATYSANQRLTLAGTDQFDNDASNPLEIILGALDVPVMRPNVGVIGQAAWTKLRTNPQVVKAANANAGDSGVATLKAVADLLELEELIVGQGFLNTARKGQVANMQRVWGKHMALMYRENTALVDGKRMTFAWTAQWGTRIAGSTPSRNIGLRGGQVVRAGESVREVISAPDLGYFLQNVVS